MRLRTLGLAAALSVSLIQTSDAVVRRKGAESPTVAAGRAPRTHREVTWPAASEMTKLGLAGWRAMVDRDTNVPLRLWGPTTAYSGAMKDPAVAEAAARQFLAAHLDLLAPGAKLADFVLVANRLGGSGDVRSVGFEQRIDGVRVIGGSIGFDFKVDRMVMVSSTALPDVHVVPAAAHLPPATIAASAISWLAAAGHAVTIRGNAAAAERVIVPLVHPQLGRGVDIEYKLAEQISVEAPSEPGRWDVWLDATTGSAIARHSTLMFTQGTVLFDVPDQDPIGPRHGRPAPDDIHTINGAQVTSTIDGLVTWNGASPATVLPGLSGPLIAITNVAGSVVADTLSLATNGTVTWSEATVEYSDAQLSAFVAASTAKHFAKTVLNPTLAYWDQQLSVNVNEQQTCNAYSTGDDIHFYIANSMCENTGRLQDVVYHEFGHSVHYNSFIPGVGAFDGSLSEGLADTLAMSITGEHGVGRGFFLNDSYLRDFAPAVKKVWPQDADGEPHDEGEILDESIWEMRKSLETNLGLVPGDAQTVKIYYGIVERAADIPSSYAAALVADDDDGDVTNGTPNLCAINAAFGDHGLADPTTALGLSAPTRDNYTITLTQSGQACPGSTIASIDVAWRARGGTDATITLTNAASTYTGVIPTQPDGTVVEYKVTVTLGSGATLVYPDNPADQYYQFYVGAVTKLWCADFEAGIGDWTHGATPTNRDTWEVGPPMGLGGDPKMAHGGVNVLGMDLSTDGLYTNNTTSYAESADIDLMGHTSVRLQYYRWLGVEDGFYDQATIQANGTKMWSNLASPTDPGNAEINHVDKEWRFQDVDMSAQTATGKIKLRFDLTSDPGLTLSGWNIDDVCLVTTDAAPGPACGNGVVDLDEECDDGNTVDGDGCSSTCQIEGTDMPPGKSGGGCCSASGNPLGSLVLGIFVVGMTLIRRRKQLA